MKEQYYPPTFNADAFHCALCGVYAHQKWQDVFIGGGINTKFEGSLCQRCEDWTYWYDGRMIVPSESPVELPASDLPADCLSEYQEARDVFARSPRASAALLRLCLQKLMPNLGESGENLNDDIASLVAKGLDPIVQKALDYCRVVGNHSVHPGLIVLNDTPEIAHKLFRMVNFIVEDRITRPKEIDKLYGLLPPEERARIEKRDKRPTRNKG